jgi:uncharacterized protein with PIN domain
VKILVDENVPKKTAQQLVLAGHDVLDVRGTAQEGVNDEVLWMLAQSQQRLLISTDKGFTRNRYSPHFGMLVILLHQPTCLGIHERIMAAMNRYPETEWRGLLVVLRDTVQSTWRIPE